MGIALRSIVRALGRRHHKRLQQLPSVEQFRHTLECERARSDRTGDEFSLLVFGVRNWSDEYDTFSQLADLFQQRLRVTDQPGWLDNHHLGVILPFTPGWGAWTLADALSNGLTEDVPRPECRVYVYPSHWTFDEKNENRDSEQPKEQETATESEQDHPVPQPMQSLFSRPIPIWKRALDVIGAGIGLILFAPLFLIIAFAIWLNSRGPVFFTQMRSGLGGRPFRMYKFRSMILNADSLKRELAEHNLRDGPAFKLAEDPRVFRVGRWLRATSLDELPQLWNVLRGEMSLVGPRPLPCDESDACLGWRSRRLDVTPGLTCTWQAEKTADTSFDDWMRMDARYTHSVSFWNDFKLLFETIPVVVLGRNE